MDPKPLIEQSLWLLLPGALFSLFMVHAMVMFTAALLTKRPRPRQQPLTADELCARLLELFSHVKFTTHYRARLLLDEATHEGRWNELMRGSNFFVGFDGWIPRFQMSFWFFMGIASVNWTGRAYGLLPGFPPRIGKVADFHLDTAATRNKVGEVVARAGWPFPPAIWWCEATRTGVALMRALLPGPLWRVPPRPFWAVVYPASYFLAIGALMGVLGAEAWTPHNLGIVAFISAIWWR